jgi:DnaJ-class molecular chaperone
MDLTTALELLQIDASEAHPSEDEVRAAYKMQALVWHPDKNADRVEVTLN